MIAADAPAWHRVASLRPRLRDDLRLVRQRERGRRWFVLRNPLGGAACRLNEPAYAIAARLDGSRTVEAVWEAAQSAPVAPGLEGDVDEPVRQDEVVSLLATLQAHGLLDAASMPSSAGASLESQSGATRPARRPGFNPIAWRMRVLDPSRLLDALAPLGAVLFSRWAVLPWLAVILGLLLGCLWHLDAILAHGARWLQSPGYVLWALVLSVPLKLLHELAHGLALRRYGVPVREAGLLWICGLPLPYVDASGTAMLPRKGPRMVVSAAGILAELAVAAVALAVWLFASHEALRAVAFVALCTAGLSTLVFNANPLQRFDGYHLLCDAIELQNLAPRSRAFWAHRLRRLLGGAVGADGGAPPDAAERLAFLLYAPAALAWQIVASVALVFWVGSWSSWLAAGAALLLLLSIVRSPALAAWRVWRRGTAGGLRHLRWVLAVVALVAGAASVVPVPGHVVAEGVVWMPEDAQVRVEAEGIVLAMHASEGEVVRAGDLIATLGNPRMEAELARHGAAVESLEHALFQALASDPVQARAAEQQLVVARAALAHAQARASALSLRAGVDGRLVLPHSADLAGSFVRQGQLLGHVMTAAATRVRVAMGDADAATLPAGEPRGVQAMLSDDTTGAARPATLLRDGGAAQARLPSAALAAAHGGSWVTYPSDATHLTPIAPVVWLDVELPGHRGARLGARAWVRFELEPAPLLSRALARLRAQVLQRFHPGD